MSPDAGRQGVGQQHADHLGEAFAKALEEATPEGRRGLLADLLRSLPEPTRPLVLGPSAACLDGLDVTGSGDDAEVVRGALRGADLRAMQARGATFDAADMTGAALAGVDLAGSTLREARVDEVDFAGALLEDVDLTGASARFADLRDVVLDGSTLRGVDLWGAVLTGADLRGCDLTDADLSEADLRGADLREAVLTRTTLAAAHLEGANLSGVDLETTDIRRAWLGGARLGKARLRGLDLSSCSLEQVHLSGAWLDRTLLDIGQLGGSLGEEAAGDFAEATNGYVALERNFESWGDGGATRSAYLRRRRMQKAAHLQRARAAAGARSWRLLLRESAAAASDELAEVVCDYGESLTRVGMWLAIIFVAFATLYLATGTVVRGSGSVTRRPLDALAFSLGAGTTAGLPDGFRASATWVHVVTGLQAVTSIALTGLFGFVLGNRIRG